jgi:hypothetical protein
MGSKGQNAFFHGIMLVEICEKIGVKPTEGNKAVIKALIKKRFEIDSLSALGTKGMSLILEHVVMFFSSEFGIELDLPGEDNSEEQGMKDFLKAVYHIRDN